MDVAFVLGFIFGIVTLASVIAGVGFFWMYANREIFPHGNTAFVPNWMKKRSLISYSGLQHPYQVWKRQKGRDSDEPESDDAMADTDGEI